jgi:hypothetical protein
MKLSNLQCVLKADVFYDNNYMIRTLCYENYQDKDLG